MGLHPSNHNIYMHVIFLIDVFPLVFYISVGDTSVNLKTNIGNREIILDAFFFSRYLCKYYQFYPQGMYFSCSL